VSAIIEVCAAMLTAATTSRALVAHGSGAQSRAWSNFAVVGGDARLQHLVDLLALALESIRAADRQLPVQARFRK
jgi:hypothetical protein